MAASAAFATGAAADGTEPRHSIKDTPGASFSWQGFYVGANLEHAWGRDKDEVSTLPSQAAFGARNFDVETKPKGFLGGLQAGYNIQAGTIVLGFEADVDLGHLKSTAVTTPLLTAGGAPIPGWNSVATTTVDTMLTLRARLGTVVNTTSLLYMTGGFAFAEVKERSLTTFTPAAPFTYAGDTSSFRMGWTVGGGYEYAFNPKWTLKTEYLYPNLGHGDYVALPLAANPPFALGHHTGDLTMHTIRAGINYKF